MHTIIFSYHISNKYHKIVNNQSVLNGDKNNIIGTINTISLVFVLASTYNNMTNISLYNNTYNGIYTMYHYTPLITYLLVHILFFIYLFNKMYCLFVYYES